MRTTLTILATCLALPVSAGTYGAFDELVVFGDSLSGGGNIAAIQGEAFPSFLYPNGQFTNGDAWTTQLGLTPSLLGGTNYAYGGARAVENGDVVPDFKAQVSQFTANGGPSTDNTLAAIWVGGNDFRDLPDTLDAAGLNDFVNGVVKSIEIGSKALYSTGIRDFVVFGLPDFGALPEFAGDAVGAGTASFVTSLLNTAIENRVGGMGPSVSDADFAFFDVNSIFQDVLSQVPEANRSLRCIDFPADCALNPTNYVFYDDIHPTSWVHTQLAEAFNDQVLQPVPLPAGATLLLTGFAGFALWGKRRKSLA